MLFKEENYCTPVGIFISLRLKPNKLLETLTYFFTMGYLTGTTVVSARVYFSPIIQSLFYALSIICSVIGSFITWDLIYASSNFSSIIFYFSISFFEFLVKILTFIFSLFSLFKSLLTFFSLATLLNFFWFSGFM